MCERDKESVVCGVGRVYKKCVKMSRNSSHCCVGCACDVMVTAAHPTARPVGARGAKAVYEGARRGGGARKKGATSTSYPHSAATAKLTFSFLLNCASAQWLQRRQSLTINDDDDEERLSCVGFIVMSLSVIAHHLVPDPPLSGPCIYLRKLYLAQHHHAHVLWLRDHTACAKAPVPTRRWRL